MRDDSMKVACDRSQVASHSPLAGEESRIPKSELVAAQHPERWMRGGTAQAKGHPAASGDET